MKFLKRKYEDVIYSEYGYFVSTITVLVFLLLVVFIKEEKLTYFIQKSGFINLTFVIDLSIIVMQILIISTCLRSIKAVARLRIIVYALFITLGVAIRFISFINYYWLGTGSSELVLLGLLPLSN